MPDTSWERLLWNTGRVLGPVDSSKNRFRENLSSQTFAKKNRNSIGNSFFEHFLIVEICILPLAEVRGIDYALRSPVDYRYFKITGVK